MFNSFLYHPIRSRIVYDAIIPFALTIFIWLLYNTFGIHPFPILIIFLTPVSIVFFNYLVGIYSRFRFTSVQGKALYLFIGCLLSYLTCSIISKTTPLVILLFSVIYAMLLLPRYFFNREKPFISTSTQPPKNERKKLILVVGGGGYIGTHLIEQLLQKKYYVRVVDAFFYGKQSLDKFKNNNNLDILTGDITDIYVLTKAIQHVYAIIHLGGIVGDPASAANPNLTRHMNSVSTRMLKETAKAFGTQRFIFASSCSVYGASKNIVTEQSKTHPLSLYARTKIDSEKELLHDTYDAFHPTILRFATVFGHSVRMRFDLVVNKLTAQAYQTGILTVDGGNQYRPCIHASDVARAIILALEAPITTVSRQIFNVGDDRLNVSIQQLATTIAAIVKTQKNTIPKIKIIPHMQDQRNYRVSFKKINTVLGFRAQTSLEDGIEEIYRNLKSHMYNNPLRNHIYNNALMISAIQKKYINIKNPI